MTASVQLRKAAIILWFGTIGFGVFRIPAIRNLLAGRALAGLLLAAIAFGAACADADRVGDAAIPGPTPIVSVASPEPTQARPIVTVEAPPPSATPSPTPAPPPTPTEAPRPPEPVATAPPAPVAATAAPQAPPATPSPTPPPPQPTVAAASMASTFGNGTFVIGDQIESGYYVLMDAEASCALSVGGTNGWIQKYRPSGEFWILLLTSQRTVMSSGCGVWKRAEPVPRDTFSDGRFYSPAQLGDVYWTLDGTPSCRVLADSDTTTNHAGHYEGDIYWLRALGSGAWTSSGCGLWIKSELLQ